MIWVVLLLIALAVLGWWLWRKNNTRKDESVPAPGPVDPFADADTDVLRGDPRRLKAADLVELYGKTLAVRGSLRLSEGDYQWSEHFLDTGTGVKRWLSVEADPDLEVVMWEEITDSDLQPGPRELSYEGVSYRSDEKGTARYVSEATTGLAPTGSVKYHDYAGPDGQKLSFERFGEEGKWELAKGLTLDRNQITIYHQSEA
ncbi:DUF4178 domain-containing protein [Glycomyces albidus]|jgi:hypothetical protein|uniref:DUF4178 domain-containing protein n=1 Tax=Glycomyces albidus TaxID=2656774 RepID=A0A6L5G4A7_9ACTN|nr:DUF4178 domain-containing protein [Glycomyces albidus]MQM24461.1 DUF4178 domain-containing protein [Glycomyces albidus]